MLSFYPKNPGMDVTAKLAASQVVKGEAATVREGDKSGGNAGLRIVDEMRFNLLDVFLLLRLIYNFGDRQFVFPLYTTPH